MSAFSIRLIAAAGVAVGAGALALQYWLLYVSMVGDGASPLAATWRYFGYFTILTNWLVLIVWTPAALAAPSPLNGPRIEGATFTAIAMVGIIYHLLLASRWHPQGWQWVSDFSVHTLIPVLFALYWFARPHGALKWAHAFLFVIWPLTYCVYALARGAVDGWYAYYFLDPKTMSLPRLALSIGMQSTGFLAGAFVVVALDRFMARSSRSRQPDASPLAP